MKTTSPTAPLKPPEREIYVVAIEDIDPVYSFTMNPIEGDPGAFKDRLRLTIVGTFQAPVSLRGRRCNLHLLGERIVTMQLSQPEEEDYKPDHVGDLAIGPEGGLYRGMFAHDSLFHVVGLIGQGLVKFVELGGKPLSRGRTDIDDIGFRLVSVHAAA